MSATPRFPKLRGLPPKQVAKFLGEQAAIISAMAYGLGWLFFTQLTAALGFQAEDLGFGVGGLTVRVLWLALLAAVAMLVISTWFLRTGPPDLPASEEVSLPIRLFSHMVLVLVLIGGLLVGVASSQFFVGRNWAIILGIGAAVVFLVFAIITLDYADRQPGSHEKIGTTVLAAVLSLAVLGGSIAVSTLISGFVSGQIEGGTPVTAFGLNLPAVQFEILSESGVSLFGEDAPAEGGCGILIGIREGVVNLVYHPDSEGSSDSVALRLPVEAVAMRGVASCG